MNTLPTVTTSPWIHEKKEELQNSGSPSVRKASSSCYIARPVSDGRPPDPTIFRSKNDFSYDMYMLNRKLRKVKRNAESHYAEFHKDLRPHSERQKQQGQNDLGGLSNEKQNTQQWTPISSTQVKRTVAESRKSSGSSESSVF